MDPFRVVSATSAPRPLSAASLILGAAPLPSLAGLVFLRGGMLSSLKRTTGLSSATVVPTSAADPSDTKLEAATLGFGISKDGLAEIVLEKDVNVLARYGGVKGVVRKLKADAEKGLRSDTVRRRPSNSCCARGTRCARRPPP